MELFTENWITPDDLHGILVRRCEFHTQKEVAAILGVSTQYVNDLVHQRRAISPEIARKLGFKRHEFYEPESH